MVSLRCKMMVKSELDRLGVTYTIVELGEVHIVGTITKQKADELEFALNEIGLELLDNKKTQLVEKIKSVVIEMVHYADELPRTNFSDYLTEKLHMDYTTMSNIFSQTKGITIEHFMFRTGHQMLGRQLQKTLLYRIALLQLTHQLCLQ